MSSGKMADPLTKIEFAVKMGSPCCASKVEKALQDVSGIKSVQVDAAKQRVVVEGHVAASTIQKAVEAKTGMTTVLLGHGSVGSNLGAGVAAINIGSSASGVQGLLRFVQSDPDTCVIEGTVDMLPTSESVYLSVHDSGDVSDGCNSCGPVLSPEGKRGGILSGFFPSKRGQFEGILGQLHPKADGRAEFRLTTSSSNISDIYGHCVVVHKGSLKDVQDNKSERLACGIIARSSGLFENSKRFCACDGVTIWEQAKLNKEM